MPTKPKLTQADAIEGVAFACLLAVAFVFLLQRDDVPIRAQQVIWFTFVVLTGASLNPSSEARVGVVSLQALAPTAVLFIGMIFQNALQIAAGAAYLSIVSRPAVPTNDEVSFVNLGLWYLLLFIATWPAVILATYARRRIVSLLKAVWNVDAKRVERIEKVINSAVRIISLLSFGWIVSR